MRGYPGPRYRGGTKFRPVGEVNAVAKSVPAPSRGWNARGNLANMNPLDAIQMDNIFPGVQDVSLRKGYVSWATGFASNIKTLIAYSGSVDKLFAAADNGIFDVTAGGAIGAAAAACTNGFWSYVNMANAGGRFLCACNGTDAYKTYDGTTWATPAITGVAGNNLTYVTLHQKRLWFIENNTMNIWYLGTDSISGAATLFPVGSLFKLGGSVIALGSWTIDSGSGSNDYFVIVTSNGEIAVYQGTDPASSTTWALTGVFATQRPVGNRPLLDYGGDLLYLSQIGVFPLSKLLQSTLVDTSQEISFNIDGAYLDAIDQSGGQFGWMAIVHKAQNMLFINVPITSQTSSYQFVMNTMTKAWCRFTGWNAVTWANSGSSLYFAGGLSVKKAWVGFNDNGTPIVGTVAQAYSGLGLGNQKDITLARINFGFTSTISMTAALDNDFQTLNGQTSINYTPATTGAIWDSSVWGTGVWDSGTQILQPVWNTIPNNLGYKHSLRLQITSSQSEWTWTSTDYAMRPAGIL